MNRMWINQPSTAQDLHKMHGTNVLADYNDEEQTVQIWLLAGETVSMQVPTSALSNGWLAQKQEKSGQPSMFKNFQNFHRNLCDRFGYHHDEADWHRDQVSLIEHIAGLVGSPRVDLTKDACRDAATAIMNFRWMLAAALTSSGIENSKESKKRMSELAKLQAKLEKEGMGV